MPSNLLKKLENRPCQGLVTKKEIERGRGGGGGGFFLKKKKVVYFGETKIYGPVFGGDGDAG
jgi:hypothetical protein